MFADKPHRVIQFPPSIHFPLNEEKKQFFIFCEMRFRIEREQEGE